jgi:hypothetical protein
MSPLHNSIGVLFSVGYPLSAIGYPLPTAQGGLRKQEGR